MKIIYARKSAGINEDGTFQNPKYFERPDGGATSVVIYGDYPEIEAAYQKLGIAMDVRSEPKPKLSTLTTSIQVGITPELQQVIDDAKSECEKVVKENELLTTQIKQLTEDLQAEHATHLAFINNTEAMQARIDELKQSASSSSGGEVANDQVSSEEVSVTTEKLAENDYASWTVPQIKDFLASKEIGFKSSASKDELLALIPKE